MPEPASFAPVASYDRRGDRYRRCRADAAERAGHRDAAALPAAAAEWPEGRGLPVLQSPEAAHGSAALRALPVNTS